jgi:hypothetical protein
MKETPLRQNTSVTLSGVGYPDPRTIATCRIAARMPSTDSRLYRS